MKKSINFWLNGILVVSILGLLVVKLYYLDRNTTLGVKLNETEKEINRLNLEIESLSDELNKLTSLQLMKEKAIQSGYTDPNLKYDIEKKD